MKNVRARRNYFREAGPKPASPLAHLEEQLDVASKLTRRHRVRHVAELRARYIRCSLDRVGVHDVQRVDARLESPVAKTEFLAEPQIDLPVVGLLLRGAGLETKGDGRLLP